MTENIPLAGRIALVTGASRGIGRACAVGLARAGAHVIATARTQGALEALDDEIRQATGEGATLVPLDLKDGAGVDQLGGAVFERWKKLDILIHAAGELGVLTPVAHLDPPVWERAVAVNMTATYRLIRSFDPLLRQSDAGRAIFLTSGAARHPQAFWGVYAATKAGMEALVEAYRDETAITPVRPILLTPGPLRTRLGASAFPGVDP
jgi:NAD(P)-dependent dehydrogenase (short-subunit alcohol dehydrogenase family)